MYRSITLPYSISGREKADDDNFFGGLDQIEVADDSEINHVIVIILRNTTIPSHGINWNKRFFLYMLALNICDCDTNWNWYLSVNTSARNYLLPLTLSLSWYFYDKTGGLSNGHKGNTCKNDIPWNKEYWRHETRYTPGKQLIIMFSNYISAH